MINHFISETVTMIMAALKTTNMPAVVAFSLVEGAFLILLYHTVFIKRVFKKLMVALLFVFIAGMALIHFIADKQSAFSLSAYSFQHIIMLIPVILYFAERMILLDDIYLMLNPMFWISSGFLFFYSAGIFYFTLFNSLFVHNRQIFIKGAIIHSAALIIMNLFITRGIWLIRKD